jgi:hypothetical protein
MKHYSPGEIMMDRCLNANDIKLSFGVYCQVAENFEPRNSLARTQAVIFLGKSGNSLNFPERHGREIGDHPQDFKPSKDDSYDGPTRHGRNSLDDVEFPGVDMDFDAELTGVEMDSACVTPKHTEGNGHGNKILAWHLMKKPSHPLHPQLRHKLHQNPRRRWWHRMPGIESNLRSMFPA